jgi:hypothetical protein
MAEPELFQEWKKNPEKYHEDIKKDQKIEKTEKYDKELVDRLMSELTLAREKVQTKLDMQRIFKDLVKNAETGYRKQMTMATIMFVTGIMIIAATAIIELGGLIGMFDLDWQAIAGGGVIGGIGAMNIFLYFVKNPAGNIQKYIGNLAQVEIAFLGFVDMLDRSDNVEVKNLDDLLKVETLISEKRRETMKDIQDYAEK